MRLFRVLAVCVAFGLLAAPARADHIIGLDGLTYVAQETVIDQDTGAAYVVGYADKTSYHDGTNGVGTSLTLTKNAVARSAGAYNSSVINSSGEVKGTGGLPGGNGGLGAFDSATVNMTGGVVQYFVLANDNGTMNVSGGRVGFARFLGNSTAIIEGAVVGYPDSPTGGTFLEAGGSSRVSVNGTTVVDEMRAIDRALVTASGVTVGRDVVARDNATFDLTGGTVGRDLIGYHSSSVAGSGVTVVERVLADGGSISLDSSSVGKSVQSSAGSLALTNVTIVEDLLPGGPASMTGGVVGGNVRKSGIDELSINGGRVVGSVTANGAGPVTLGGGATVGDNVTLWAGSIGDARIGGNLVSAGNQDANKITITGGTIGGDLLANGRGSVVLSSGQVAGDVVVGDGGHVEMSGGTVRGNFDNNNFSTIRGGSVLGHLNVNAGFVRVEGGIVQQDANVAADSQLYLLDGAVAGKASAGPGGLLFMAGGTLAGNADLGRGARGSFFGGTVAVDVNAPAGAEVTIGEGGHIMGYLHLGEGSSAVMRDGTVGLDVMANGTDQTVFNMTGGRVGGFVHLSGAARAIVSGGTIGDIFAGDATRVEMTGGRTSFFNVDGAATAVIEGGVFNRIYALNRGTVTLTGGEVNEFVLGRGTATVTMSGSVTVPEIDAKESSRFTIKGGSVSGRTLAADNSSMTIEGGNFGGFSLEGDASVLIDNTQSGSTVRTSLIGVRNSAQLTVTGPTSLFITEVAMYDDAVLLLNGGDVERGVTAASQSTVNVTHDAVVGFIDLYDTSVLTMTAGTVRGNVVAHDSNIVVVNGGQMGLLRAESGSEVIFGGTAVAKQIHAAGSSYFFVNNGRVATDVAARDRAVLSLGGGATVEGDLIADDDARLGMLGGTVRKDLVAKGRAEVHVGGGTIAGRALLDAGVLFHWSGGTINGIAPVTSPAAVAFATLTDLASSLATPLSVSVFADGASTVHVYGTELEAVLSDPDYLGVYSLYQLTGRFADGTEIGGGSGGGAAAGAYFALANGSGASYLLLPPSAIPEPGSVVLVLALAVACVAARPRRRERRW